MAVATHTQRAGLFDAPASRRTQPPLVGPSRVAPPRTPSEPAHRHAVASAERTLEDFITTTWGGLRLTGSAACPLCGGELAARYGSGPNPVGGRCRSCATELA